MVGYPLWTSDPGLPLLTSGCHHWRGPTSPLPNHWYLVVITEDLFKLVHVRPLRPTSVVTTGGGHQSGRYASYWNAVLFHVSLEIYVTVKRRWTNINDSMEAVKFITTWNANWVIHYIIFVKGFSAIFMLSYHSTTHYTARKSSFSPKKQAVFLMYWARKVIFQQRTQWYNAHLPQPISSAKLPFFISVRNGTILSPGDI